MIMGGCLCGRVRYEAHGAPLFSVFCHCRDCQKASGTGGVPVMGMSKDGFRVTGDPKSVVTVGGSKQQAVRYFCPDCGSLLFGMPQVVPDNVTLYVGSLDEPERFKPDHAIFTRDRPSWAKMNLAIPEYDTLPQI
jgi:hypothetical protein